MSQRTWLRELRGTRTQKEFAEELEIDRTYYCQLEKGKRGISVTLARELADKFTGVGHRRVKDDKNDYKQERYLGCLYFA